MMTSLIRSTSLIDSDEYSGKVSTRLLICNAIGVNVGSNCPLKQLNALVNG